MEAASSNAPPRCNGHWAGNAFHVLRRSFRPAGCSQPVDRHAGAENDRVLPNPGRATGRQFQPVSVCHPVPFCPGRPDAVLWWRHRYPGTGHPDPAATFRSLGARGRAASRQSLALVRTQFQLSPAGACCPGRAGVLHFVPAPGESTLGYSGNHAGFKEWSFRFDVAGEYSKPVHG